MAFTTLGLSSAIKSIQRGDYAGAGGDVVISSVDITKTVVISVSNSSAGYVSVSADVVGALAPSSGGINIIYVSGTINCGTLDGGWPSYSGTRSLSGGTTALTTKAFSAILKDATHITCDGPCEWQVVEYL